MSYSYEDIEGISSTVASGVISEALVVAEGEERTTWFVWLLVACASISGLLFGECEAHSGNTPRAASLNIALRL